MPFLCCIRKLKEPEYEHSLVQHNGDPCDKKINANGVSTPVIDVGVVSREKNDKDKSDENSKESHKSQNKVASDGNISSSALPKARTEQKLQDDGEPVKKETLTIQEHANREMNSGGHADDSKTQADIDDVQKYEELVTRLEELTSCIEIQFKEDSALSTDASKNFEAAATAEIIKPVDQPTFLEFHESSNLWHANNVNNSSLTNIDAGVGQSVRISSCKNTTFRITGKVEKLEILDCTSCSFVVEEVNEVVISACKKLELQALKDMTVVRASDVDGLLMYLSDCNANITKFFTRKCSEVNFSCPTKDGQVELALSEQLSTHWDGQKWVSEVYTHKG